MALRYFLMVNRRRFSPDIFSEKVANWSSFGRYLLEIIGILRATIRLTVISYLSSIYFKTSSTIHVNHNVPSHEKHNARLVITNV